MISLRKITGSAALGLGILLQACDGGPTGPKTGSLTVNIANLPTDVPAAVIVQGAVGTPPVTVTATRTIADLEPGTYTITAAKAVGTKASYIPTLPSQVAEVVASTTPAAVNVGYALATGSANVVISGLPAGVDAAVTIYNGSGFFVNVKQSGEVGNLEPGAYTLQADPLSADEVYAGQPVQTQFTITASPTPVQVAASYAATTGSIQFSASGLPAGAVPVWDVSGPNSFSMVVRGNETQVLSKLAPGTYLVSARTFDFGADTWGAASPPVTVNVTAGTKAPAAFAYITRPPSLNLTVEGAYVTQSTQRFDGSVPLVAGRPAFLRVFVKANELNSAAPKVRARFYRAGALVLTETLDAGAQSVGTSVNERSLPETWGLPLPAELITGALSFVVDVDPANTVREVNEGDNAFPASGAPVSLNVRSVPAVEIRFVPIETAVNSLVGNVTETRVPTLMGEMLKMFPIAAWSADVRAPFTTNAAALVSNDANGSWVQIINELNTLRVAEATPRHYVGILKATYSSGVAGLGFVPGKTVLSWDFSSAPSTVAHELGHNWGRNHAPCGGPAGVDQNYPYPNARIGVYGFDLANRVVLDANDRRDLMSYCGPEWVSDYTYEGILNFRGNAAAASISGSVQSALMVWGRVEGEKMILEPSFLTDTRPQLPVANGQYRVAGYDASGSQVFSISFDPERVGDTEQADVRQFGFAVPMSAATAAKIVSLRFSGNGREVRNVPAASGTPDVAAAVASPDRVRLTWDSSRFPMLVVRDPDTKEILAFARGGNMNVRTGKRTLDITASNRVSSSRMMVPARY